MAAAATTTHCHVLTRLKQLASDLSHNRGPAEIILALQSLCPAIVLLLEWHAPSSCIDQHGQHLLDQNPRETCHPSVLVQLWQLVAGKALLRMGRVIDALPILLQCVEGSYDLGQVDRQRQYIQHHHLHQQHLQPSPNDTNTRCTESGGISSINNCFGSMTSHSVGQSVGQSMTHITMTPQNTLTHNQPKRHNGLAARAMIEIGKAHLRWHEFGISESWFQMAVDASKNMPPSLCLHPSDAQFSVEMLAACKLVQFFKYPVEERLSHVDLPYAAEALLSPFLGKAGTTPGKGPWLHGYTGALFQKAWDWLEAIEQQMHTCLLDEISCQDKTLEHVHTMNIVW